MIAVQKPREQREARSSKWRRCSLHIHLAEQRYQGGRASYLDSLTSSAGLYESELAWLARSKGKLASVVQLYKVLGGGWSEMVKDHVRRTNRLGR